MAEGCGTAGTPREESLESRLGLIEIALRDQNRHIITGAVFAGEAGRTLKDANAELSTNGERLDKTYRSLRVRAPRKKTNQALRNFPIKGSFISGIGV